MRYTVEGDKRGHDRAGPGPRYSSLQAMRRHTSFLRKQRNNSASEFAPRVIAAGGCAVAAAGEALQPILYLCEP